MVNLTRSTAPILAVVLLAAQGGAQAPTKPSVEEAFSIAQSHWAAGRWEEALGAVDALRALHPRSDREAAATLIAAQAALKGRMLARAMAEAQSLVVRFPESPNLDAARWVMAECAILAERWDEAQDRLNYLAAFGARDTFKTAARARLNELRRYLEFQARLEVHPDTTSPTAARISLILPLSGGGTSVGQAFLKGFEFRWNRSAFGELTVLDTEGDPVRAARLVQAAAAGGGWCAIGGLNPGEAAAGAAAAETAPIPFLTTWCGSEGLAALGRYVFQGRPDYARSGWEMALIAVNRLGLAKFAILAPLANEGRQLVAAFRAEITALGGEIIIEEVYYPGAEDFNKQFNNIRARGLRLAFDDSLQVAFRNQGAIPTPDGLLPPRKEWLKPAEIASDTGDTTWALSAVLLDSLWRDAHDRVRKMIADARRPVDSLEIPVTAFDGLLFIIEPGKIEIAAPQFARANLRARLMGGENWADREALRKVRSYVDGIVFIDPFGAVGGDEVHQLMALSADGWGMTERQALFAGERAARMVEFAARRASGPETMRLALSQIRDLNTLSGDVTLLKEERVDRIVRLTLFTGGEYLPVK